MTDLGDMLAVSDPCMRCGHPPAWHRVGENQGVDPTWWPLRCLGADPRTNDPKVDCDCPKFLP